MVSRVSYAIAVAVVAVAAVAVSAQQTAKPAAGAMRGMKPMSDQEILKLAASAGPADISANATIVDHGGDGKPRTLRTGTNGWVCMAHPEVMCLDKQWQEWADAWMNKRNPKVTAVGIGYMLQGDTGASNTDPFATAPTATNQWVASPAHIMVLTPDVKQLDALPTSPTNGGPFVMWKGTPYAHIMVPTAPMPKK
jgi:hypothetical protein